MKVNIYGSTGEIGKKTLNLISKHFPNYKINLLCANKNYKLLIKQIKLIILGYFFFKRFKFFAIKIANFFDLAGILMIFLLLVRRPTISEYAKFIITLEGGI